MQLLPVLLLLLNTVAAIQQHWVNTNALRTIDLAKSYVKESLAIIIENISDEPQNTYLLPVEDGIVYSSFEAREKSKTSSTTKSVHVEREDDAWRITLTSPIAAGKKITLAISSSRFASTKPAPAKVDQNGKQYLAFSTSDRIPSYYRSIREKTKLKLPNNDVVSHTEGGDLQGSVLTYGPFDNSVPGVSDQISLRYENTVPLPWVTYMERDIEVSHWGGNVAFEDRYALTNKGAELKSPFDRIAYAQSAFYNPNSYAIRSLTFPLPVGSRDAYFTDEIGNVSTSKFRSTFREANLEVKPRYPIFGGWNYTFTVGWNNDLTGFLHQAGNKHYLKVPFLEGADDMSYQDLRVRVILPEGATNIKVDCPVPNVSIKYGKLWTFMDTLGRSVVLLEAENLTEERGRENIYVEYEYSQTALYRKPLVVVGVVAMLFVSSIVLGQII